MPSEQSSSTSTDVFSLSDRVLAEKLLFVKEIGFGNWGSVWLCRPRVSNGGDDAKLAVKLVHRSKTTTTAARVRSLWNEMKVVRTFKDDPHPSIVPFHSFIITPSYALITMEYLPDLVPVEVPELKAKEWFHSLVSGVKFLHSRGVVHNDIKPANILLSERQVPVLVDFGFAQKYDMGDGKAFHSNLTYGTPEYLSPERARGLPHDTRKADIWSLGVTFFEILIGRTPFEHTEGEPFTTKAALEDYWARTMRGKWLGSWKMSKGVEKMLHRMIQPNADLRCTALELLEDSYWTPPLPASGRRAPASGATPDRSTSRNVVPPWSSHRASKAQRSKREQTEKKHDEKENAPTTVPRPKKVPSRQRVLSGTDGMLYLTISEGC
ncbi:kinase-like domain-containing protein [Russula earlei]|uniref:Kinase-like domain-containing protein n=1 Tax=Russula earlei TaxID=71964 RepID=A0ACC0UD84_9AGAM|nr:kinase-like domain-containing protein [Russula earlei]